MEAQIFTPDSRRLVVHRSAHPHGSRMDDPEHRFLLCDLADSGRLTPLTQETGATAPSLSPDGKYLYYFVNQTAFTGGRLTLKRVSLDTRECETLKVIDGFIPGTHYVPTRIYPLSTISTDGNRIALACYLGDGVEQNAPWGLMVFDVAKGEVRLILSGQTWCNLHPQFSRNPARTHDILVQDNHGNVVNKEGVFTTLVSGRCCDIHVIRDDGTDFRSMPWGRDNNEFCQGHQCWRGRSDWAITSGLRKDANSAPLIEGTAAPDIFHQGLDTPGGRRNDLTRNMVKPQFYHFGTDIAGRFIASDRADPAGLQVAAARLGEPGKDPISEWVYLVQSRSNGKKDNHIHPFMSLDGTKAFFNSDESGTLQAYMVSGLENVFKS
jgi:hypothetical protein